MCEAPHAIPRGLVKDTRHVKTALMLFIVDKRATEARGLVASKAGES